MGAKSVFKMGIFGLIGLLMVGTISSSIFTVGAGQNAIERTPSGTLIAHMTPGIKFKIPFLTDVQFYDEVTTIVYTDNANAEYGNINNPYYISFADTYGGYVKGSVRIELPKDPDKLVKLHEAFKRYDNFIENGAEKFTNELLAYTANQFTGENFLQGGQNEYKNRLEDQARNGLYVTKREQVTVQQQAGIASLKNDSQSKTTDSEAVIYRNVIQRDANGQPIRQQNSMEIYGILITQVTIDGFIPQQDLEAFMNNKKEMVRKRARLVEDQENERQQAVTAKLKGDRERVEASQKMLLEKDRAEISLAKEVEVAKLQAEKEAVERQKLADLAIIDKKKELQIATDNEAIQKANAAAAKYEAVAILEKGLAEAKVTKAVYDAYDKQLYSMEIQRDTMMSVTKNLQGINIKMPNVYIGSNGEGGQSMNSIDTVLNAIGVQKLEEISKIK